MVICVYGYLIMDIMSMVVVDDRCLFVLLCYNGYLCVWSFDDGYFRAVVVDNRCLFVCVLYNGCLWMVVV
jgi:hypothetical protein